MCTYCVASSTSTSAHIACNRHPTEIGIMQRKYAMVSMNDSGSDISGKQYAVPIPLEAASKC